MARFLLVVIFVFSAASSQAEGFVWKNQISFLSDYYSRGISQTNNLPSPQFETTVFHESGFFAGLFVSRVEYADGDQADQELDYYVAFNESIDNFYYRLGLLYFTYPNSDSSLNYNFLEWDFGLGYQFAKLYSEISLRYSPNHFAASGKANYFKWQTKVPISSTLNAKGHIAHRQVEDNQAFFNIPDSYDWEIGLEYRPIENVELISKYVNSDFKNATECPGDDLCSGRVIAGIRYHF